MDDDVDIYGDLPSFDVNECATCKERAKEFTEKYAKLEEEILLWKGKCENFEQEKNIILTNASSLMKTARAEVERKDRIIIELRRELEDVKFRRGVWSKSKTNHHHHHPRHESREHKTQKGTKRYEKELSVERVQAHSMDDQPVAWTMRDEDEEDPEQKWDPECKNFTVYGERLRKKLLQEQKVERIRKEEAETSEPKSSILCFNEIEKLADQNDGEDLNVTKVNEESQQEEESKSVPSDGTQLAKVEEERHDTIDGSVKPEYHIDEHYEELSEEGELSESSELQSENENRCCKESERRNGRYETSPNRRPEIQNHRDDSNHRNSNFNHDLRYNLLYKPRNRSRNSTTFGYPDRTSRRDGESKPIRQNHDPRGKSNYRSRCKTPNHKYHKTNNRHRKERHRDHSDKYENHREDRLTADKYNYTDPYYSKNNYDLRDSFERKYDDRFASRNDHDRNYDSDHKRPGKSRSPGENSRSKSNSSRSSQNDRRRNERSKSRGRFNTNNNITLEKDRIDQRRKSKDRKIISMERANDDSQMIQPMSKSLRRSSVENVKTKTSEGSKITNNDESREKSRRTSSHHNDRRPIETPKSHERLNSENNGESKVESNEKKEEFGNREIVSEERDNDDSELIKPTSESSRRNSVENVKNTISKDLKVTNSDKSCETAIDNAEVESVILEKIVTSVDTQDKFILMLENDSEVALSPITKPEIESIGSRSFREEKIENIEKFIQDYQYDATHCSLLGNDGRSGQEEENKFVNSTSSIVDTLSMDVDDIEKELECKITTISKNSNDVGLKESTINQKSKEKTINKKLEADTVNEKEQILTTVPKVDNSDTTEEPRDVSLNKKSEDIAVNEKFDKAIVNEKMKNSSVEKELETRAVQQEKVEIIEKLENTAIEEKKEEIVGHKLGGQGIDKKKSENTSIDKKAKRSTSKNKLHHIGSDGKAKEVAINLDEKKSRKVRKKLEKVDGDKKSKITQLIDQRTENKESSEKLGDSKMEKKLKNSNVLEKTDDTMVNRKCEEVSLDRKSKNVSLVKTCDNGGIDKKLESVVIDSVSTNGTIDKNWKKMELNKKSETVEIKESDKTIFKISPPLPPSPQLPALPPLPPSPPSEEKLPELSIVQKVSTIKAQIKKLQTEKVVSKQTKNRPRIPCLPIVSLYSRNRRGMVLTDSTSSHTIVSSLKHTKELENAKENVVSVQETPEIGSKSHLTPFKIMEPSIFNEVQSENSTDELVIPETDKKMAPTKLVVARDTSKLKKVKKIISNSSLDHDEPEVNFPSNVATSNVDKKCKNKSPVGLSLKEQNIDDKITNDVVDKVEEIPEPKVESTKTSDKIHTNCTSSKFSERAKRSVLKTIATTTASTESGSSNRKRPLSKEKENQSKSAKQAKVMIIKRRRPVHLEDSSTVTTLVPSEHEESSKDNKIQSSEKNGTSGRKRRAAES